MNLSRTNLYREGFRRSPGLSERVRGIRASKNALCDNIKGTMKLPETAAIHGAHGGELYRSS